LQIKNPLELEAFSNKQLQELAMAQRMEFIERHPVNAEGESRSIQRLREFIS
jgi:hypothetical protein